ncbi:MAG: hydrogenase maturation nickel metallochaperone HypA [Chloroflexota bacterium]
MHEWPIAREILEKALAEADSHRGKRIGNIRLSLVETSHIDSSSLRLAIEALSKGTIAEGAQVEIESVHQIARCLECGATLHVSEEKPVCLGCGASKLEILAEGECFLESLDMD